MRFTEARNENPPDGGLTRAGELPYAEFAVRVIVNLHGCSSRVKHPITQPLDMGQICQRRAGRLDRAAYRLPKRSGPKNRGYTGIGLASLPPVEMGGRGAIPGLPSMGCKSMRWVVRSDQAEYMRERQKQNKNKIVKAELWAKQKLETTGQKWNTQTIWGCRLFDFWCHRLGIAVEIDGLTHDKNYDAARDQYNFYRSGIIVLRVPNYDETAMDAALEAIAVADTWEVRKVKMREQYGLQEGQNFSDILKIVGIKKAHGNWSPTSW